jgi:translocation and assembly module TamB
VVRAAARAVAWLGWAALGGLALAGLALSAAALLASVPIARPWIASAVVRFADDALAGGVALQGIEVLPGGALQLRDLQITDPDGRLVLAVGRARVSVDVTALRSRIVGFEVELDAPSVLLEEGEGGVSLARAFAPARRPAAPGADGGGGGGSPWTVHLSRVEIRAGELWWVDGAGETRLEAGAVDLSARGTIGPARARAEVKLRGELREPVASPIALQGVLSRRAELLRLPLLGVDAGGTELSALGEWDLARRSGRVAVTRLGVARELARALVPAAPEGADLSATGYAEADGASATLALRVEPIAPGGPGGRGDAAIAVQLDALSRGAGFDVALERLDPARLAAQAPSGELTLTARGAVAGTSLERARGRLRLAAARSRLRRGEVTRADVQLRVEPGAVQVQRLSAAAPGLAVSGTGRWRRGGPVSGTGTIDAHDLAQAARNLGLLLGERAPALGGRARLEVELSGTSSTPALSGTLESSALRAGAVSADGIRLALRGSGPLRAPAAAQAEGRIAHLRRGGRELARQIALRATLTRAEAVVSATAAVPGTGTGPLAVDARARRGPRDTVLVTELAIGWPGTRWTLARPATLDLGGPSVDLLELHAEPQRIALSGGLGPGGALTARAELSRVDLARLPPGVLAEEGLAGEITGTVEASGAARRPVVAARVELAGGAFRGLSGLAARAEAELDGAARRARAAIAVTRRQGGSADVAVELPVPLADRRSEPLAARVRATGLPIAELLAAAGSDVPAAGALAIDARVGGTVGAPSLSAELAISDAAWQDLDGLGGGLALEEAAGRVRASGTATLGGRRVLAATAEAPLELADLLARPEEAFRELPGAPLHATATITSLDLAALAGHAGFPPRVAGVVSGVAELSGSAAAPRGQATLELQEGVWRGWRRIGARVALAARADGLTASGRVTAAGSEAVLFDAGLGLAPERLASREALLAAPLRLQAAIPRVALAPATAEAIPLAGTLEGRVAAGGTLAAPELAAELAGVGVTVEGRPLGDGRVTARYRERRAEAEAVLRPSAGGAVRAALVVEADLGVRPRAPPLLDSPAEATLLSEGVDLGFLPALAPATIRSAGGRLVVDVRAKGPLSRLSPRGTVQVSNGRLAVAELGEWTDVALDARVTDDAVELARLDVRRGAGRLSASGALRGIRSGGGRLEAKVTADSFSVARAGMDIATFDLVANATGALRGNKELLVDVNVPRGVVRLPKRTPRELQSLERRRDIVIGRPERRREVRAPAEAGGAASPEEPFTVVVHVVAPKGLFVKSDNPKVDVELKADVRYELAGGQDYAEGSIEVVRGTVEPIAGRNFTLERGRVQFTGGPPRAALLDVEAKYQNPAAVVTVNVAGTISSPEIRLSSQPPMDEAQIAMLIATGRTELKAGSGGVGGSITGEEAGWAALGAIATQAFRNLVQDRLPLDTVALDSGALRAGKYVTDKIYVGYIRRFDADPTRNENQDEVRVEYQITPRWMFESRYGNAQSGGASLIWSRDY